MVIADVDPAEFYLQQELEEFERIFNSFDVTGDGSIGAAECSSVFQCVGIHIKQSQIDLVIKEFDEDQSGEIEFDEFVVMMIKLLNRRVRADCIDYREYLTEPAIDKYDKMYRKYDEGGDGSIGRPELELMFKDFGLELNPKQMDDIITEVDKDGSGEIEFDEFCAMMAKLTGARKRIQPREYVSRTEIDRYRAAFDHFDSSGDGSIDAKELDGLLRKMGIILKKDQVDNMLKKYDADDSGEVDFQEFASMMVDLRKLRRKRKINPDTTDALSLRHEGFSAQEVKDAGFTASMMREAGFSVANMYAANIKALMLRRAGFSATDLRHGGIGPAELKRVGFSSADLRNAGYSTRACREVNNYLCHNSTDVPNFDERRECNSMGKYLPQHLPAQSTPRIRFYSDDTIQVSKGQRKSMKKVTRTVMAMKRMRSFGMPVSPPSVPRRPSVTAPSSLVVGRGEI